MGGNKNTSKCECGNCGNPFVVPRIKRPLDTNATRVYVCPYCNTYLDVIFHKHTMVSKPTNASGIYDKVWCKAV